MASVKKFPRCKIWSACYAAFTGKWSAKGRPIFERRQRTTRLTEKDEAMQIAIAFEIQSKKAAAGAWNQMQAREFTYQITALSGNAPSQSIESERFIKEWLETARHDKRKGEKTIRNYDGIISDILEFLGPARRSRSIAEFNRPVIFEFRIQEQRNGKSISTINKALGVIKQICDAAMISGAITEHPFYVPGPKLFFPRGNKTAQKRKHFTFEQFKQLVAATDPKKAYSDGCALHAEWQTFIMVTGYTGGRQQEPATLTWENVDFTRRVLVLDVSKKRDEHLMPLHPALERCLKKIRPENATGFIMPFIAAQTGQTLSKVFRETILPRIGIVQPYNLKVDNPEKGSGRVLAPYSIHSLRHSLSTWLAELGVPESTAMAITGHEDSGVSRGYTHVELLAARAGLGKVGSVRL